MKTKYILILVLLFSYGCAGTQSFPDRTPADVVNYAVNPALKKISDVHVASKAEEVVMLQDARIVMADYPLLRLDFPELRNLSSEEIDDWLIKNTAVMSKTQASQEIVNTKINSWATKSAYRPPEYGRALVIPVSKPYAPLATEEIGLIDAKGVGAVNPALRDHGDGLATLGECIREFVYEKMVNKVFDHSKSGIKTVGTYAVIDAGFDLRHTDKSTSPAGIVLRQAHERYVSKSSLFSEENSLKIENILRRYGLTSAGAYRSDSIERINVQGTKKGAVLDFGGFLTVDHFEKRAKHFYGNKILIDAKLANAIQPDESIRIPLEIWGSTVSGKEDPKLDNVWLWSHDLARAFREGRANRNDANQHVRNLLNPVYEKLSHTVVGASPQNCLELINNLLH